ncbi:glycosyltransferase family 2 protein [Favolaschia claudopus]|uniref:chitin synthase n=1 Tax=Favolaschia claudopus TaxID=2862362 RepID=A0AAW0DX32_9AGAR
MDYGGQQQRPPRQARPGRPQSSSPAAPPERPFLPNDGSRGNVSFTSVERGDRRGPLSPHSPSSPPSAQYPQGQQRGYSMMGAGGFGSAYQQAHDLENGADAERVLRKKSLVRPDREKIEPGHRQWHYRSTVANLEEEGGGRGVGVLPSTTGNYPQREALRRGRSLLAREEDVHESGLALFKRGATLRRKRSSASAGAPLNPSSTTPSSPSKLKAVKSKGCLGDYVVGPKGPWMLYCYLITVWIPSPFMRACGLKTPEQQRAWREKMGLIAIILSLVAIVGFITFGFTQAVCGTPPNRFHGGAIGDTNIGKGSVVINGYDYDLGSFHHPSAGTTFDGTTNPLFVGNWGIAGNDISFMFQKTNEACLGVLTKPNSSQITGKGVTMDWYFPCNVFSQYGGGAPAGTGGERGGGGVNATGYGSATSCHTGGGKGQLAAGTGALRKQGQVYFTWDDVRNGGRSLAVYESSVLDLSLLTWLDPKQINIPPFFKEVTKYAHTDMTMAILRQNQRVMGACLQDIITVGFIDTKSIGCVASEVLLYLSLIFIVGVVLIRFAMAVMFAWFFSHKLGNFPKETYEERMERSREIEAWSADIYKPAPGQYRPNVTKNGGVKGEKRKTFLPSTSRFTPAEGKAGPGGAGARPVTSYGALDASSGGNWKRSTVYAGSIAASSRKGGGGVGTPGSGSTAVDRSSKSVLSWGGGDSSSASSVRLARGTFAENPCPFPLHGVVPQPPADYEPFNFPLAHTICLVTAYSESFEGLRTTLDSLATTDYPNSHKLILVIADGMVKGAGNDMTTPEIVLTMMSELVVPKDEVEAHSYVAIADGHKRHNMAKVYAGWYAYDDATVERSKQQRVPIVLVAKCGNPLEAGDSKPGNRGKRDSQIVLMAFLQKVMFDERMTTFEYEFFNSIWRVTGVSPDRYELVLCVDADTKIFPDSLTKMASCMVCDEEIMGLCGETKIANKAETFVTMMQVFEYYISHHLTKAFESMFGGVTCLPGCFSMYRIKAPKGDSGFWVPILANPDIVEHYSENVVDTLHKKNLLLLGEDRYLTTLMLKTFPKRKNMFCPQAVCKTIVPDTFRVLLSQRRRWINSTIHNLAELVLVRDLCGTFCFSMQFVVGMELAGTLVLPAAISFTLYLIIASIIPHHTNTTIPLVLLAVVLGIPGVLIVITSRKWAYVGWMVIYLLSLPVWNGVLPAYAFWHFDDFSWGQTRVIAGEGKGAKDHGDKEGEFDSSHIVMKRWAEFERERRWKSGTQSRDSDEYYKGNNRHSLISTSDQYHAPSQMPGDSSTVESSAGGYSASSPRQRHDSNTLLMLPTPLAVSRNTTSSAGHALSSSSGRGSDEGGYYDTNTSAQYLLPQSAPVDTWSDSYDPQPQQQQPQRPPRSRRSIDIVAPSPTSANPFLSPRASASTATSGSTSPVMYDEPEAALPVQRPPGRGVQLTDGGPVPSPEGGVRRVARQGGRRPTSQAPVGAGGQGSPQQQQPQQQNRYSRNSTGWSLPPGAAPPQSGSFGHH